MKRRSSRILLIGMMGSGKTAIGRELGRRTGWPFLDNDALVRELTGREPAAIDANDGEDALHAAEARAFQMATDRSGPAIVAVAGWIVDDDAARARLAAAGHVVWLRARPDSLRTRIGSGAGRRADAQDVGWLEARATEREPRYRETADQVVDVDDLDPAAIAAAILDTIGLPSAG